MAPLTELEATVAQLREEADLLRARCDRYEIQRRQSMAAIDRAYAARWWALAARFFRRWQWRRLYGSAGKRGEWVRRTSSTVPG